MIKARRLIVKGAVDISEGAITQLEAKGVTMYDTAAYIVKPATRKKRNSLMEVISRGPQPPGWTPVKSPSERVFHPAAATAQLAVRPELCAQRFEMPDEHC